MCVVAVVEFTLVVVVVDEVVVVGKCCLRLWRSSATCARMLVVFSFAVGLGAE